MSGTRLYTVTRQDLSPGQQIAQTGHAVAEFCVQRPVEARAWNAGSNTIVCLSVPSETHLRLARDWFEEYTALEEFYEPDFAHELTGLAFLLREDQAYLSKTPHLSLSLAQASTGTTSLEWSKRRAVAGPQPEPEEGQEDQELIDILDSGE